MSSNSTDASGVLAELSPYGYTPSRGVAITFIVLFGISTVLHIGQATRYRLWWLYYTVCLCGVMEILGWIGRLWSTYSILSIPPFRMQIILCIIAPTPLLAANFVILGRIIKSLGPAYSRLSPRMYSIIFCTCDILSLFIQAGGAGIAAGADTSQGAQTGSNIMLFGIIFQLAVIVVYSLCGLEFYVRYAKDKAFTETSGAKIWEKKSLHLINSSRRVQTREVKFMTYGLIFNTTALFIRAIYRVIELAGGWDGPIMANELYFNVLDGAMIVIAIYTLNFIHPGLYLEDIPENGCKAEPVDVRVV